MPAVAAVRFDEQVQLNPVRHLAGRARALTAAGGRLYEQTRATSVDDVEDGVKVTTPSGATVRARHAVVATLLPYAGRAPGHDAVLIATGMHKWDLTNGTHQALAPD